MSEEPQSVRQVQPVWRVIRTETDLKLDFRADQLEKLKSWLVEKSIPLGSPLSTWSSLCQELRSRDVLAVLIRSALRWCLLGSTRMFLISREVH